MSRGGGCHLFGDRQVPGAAARIYERRITALVRQTRWRSYRWPFARPPQRPSWGRRQRKAACRIAGICKGILKRAPASTEPLQGTDERPVLSPLSGPPQTNGDRQNQVIVPANARLIGGAAGGANVPAKVPQLLSKGMCLAQLGGEPQLAGADLASIARVNGSWRRSSGARLASPRRCRQ